MHLNNVVKVFDLFIAYFIFLLILSLNIFLDIHYINFTIFNNFHSLFLSSYLKSLTLNMLNNHKYSTIILKVIDL